MSGCLQKQEIRQQRLSHVAIKQRKRTIVLRIIRIGSLSAFVLGLSGPFYWELDYQVVQRTGS